MIESESQDEVTDSLHEAAEHEDRQWSDGQKKQQQDDQREKKVITLTQIDQAGAKAAGDRGVTAPFQNPTLQRNNRRDHQQSDARQDGRFAVIGNLISDQRIDFR